MITYNALSCPIWGMRYNITPSYPDNAVLINSDRAGGAYLIDPEVPPNFEILEDVQKVRLTTLLVDQRIQGTVAPKVTPELIEDAKNKPPLPAHERAERLLRYFANKTDKVGSSLDITNFWSGSDNPMYWGALAWSESTEKSEVRFLVKYLKEIGWTSSEDDLKDSNWVNTITVSVEGYSHIADLASKRDSAQCFVAMWFGKDVDVLYHQGIKPAIEAAGYTAIRIDEKPHANKIDDEIIAEIRRSRFLVADFTHGKDGARGGVYYEAGFALGLNRPVIFSCREDMFDKLHFDTRQYNHISWKNENLDEFRKNLTNRIEALIGEGPNKGTMTT